MDSKGCLATREEGCHKGPVRGLPVGTCHGQHPSRVRCRRHLRAPCRHPVRIPPGPRRAQFPNTFDTAVSIHQACDAQARSWNEAIAAVDAIDQTIDPQHETNTAVDEAFDSFDQTDRPTTRPSIPSTRPSFPTPGNPAVRPLPGSLE